jgi:hypothetical protein
MAHILMVLLDNEYQQTSAGTVAISMLQWLAEYKPIEDRDETLGLVFVHPRGSALGAMNVWQASAMSYQTVSETRYITTENTMAKDRIRAVQNIVINHDEIRISDDNVVSTFAYIVDIDAIALNVDQWVEVMQAASDDAVFVMVSSNPVIGTEIDTLYDGFVDMYFDVEGDVPVHRL